jgi:hypothetical protein
MGLFDRLFRNRQDDESRGMTLRLQHPPTPEFASRHAEIVVKAARDISGVELDYSPQSLDDVDRILRGFHAEGLRADQIGETVFSFGCYVGEVMVRRDRGLWKLASETNLPREHHDGNDAMVIELPNGVVCNPIGKAFKLLERGEGESVAYFYQVFTSVG